MSDLVTGEAVPLEMRLAKLPSRVLALLIDAAILAVVGIALFIVLEQVIPGVDQALASAIVLAVMVALVVGVPTTVETLTRGRTVGKMALGLRVVRDDGGPIRFRHALVRALAGVFADFVITLGAGAVITSLLNERGKRIGDILAGTVVVRERIPSSTGPAVAVPPQLAAWAGGLDLSALPDGLALAARTYLARLPQLSPQVRDRLGNDLATSMAAAVSPPAPYGTPAPLYLAAVLGERHRRELQRLTATTTGAQTTIDAPQPSGPAPAPEAPPESAPTPPDPNGFQPPR